MAAPTCTMCEENQGVLMDTNLQDGETQVICGPCLPGYVLGMATVLTAGMSVQESEAYGPMLDAIAANDQRPAKPPATNARVRSPKSRQPEYSATAPPAETGSDESLPNGGQLDTAMHDALTSDS